MNLEVKIITGMLIIWKSVVKSLNKAQETIDFEYKKIDPLTIGELDSYLKANFCYIYGDEFQKIKRNDRKAENRFCFNGKYQGAIDIDCNLNFVIP